VSLRAPGRAVARILVTFIVTLTGGTAVALLAPTSAFAESTYSMEAQFVGDMNAARQAAGLAPYSVAYDLTSVARQHSAAMASQQSLYHNPGLTTEIHNWQAVGENVGEGPTVSDIHTAFMQSPEHRANILDHDFTQVGVGVSVDKNGIIWVTEDFREPMQSTTTAAPVHHSSGSASAASAPSTASSSVSTVSSPTAAPAPTASPRAVLLHRLHDLRRAHAHHSGGDPVSQSFAYVSMLTTLAR
jgi:hypothetical protein